MSAIEQALRQIDEQEKNRVYEAAGPAEVPLTRLAQPLPPPAPSGRFWTWLLLGAAAVTLLTGGWAVGKFASSSAGEATRSGQKQSSASVRSEPVMSSRPTEPVTRITFVPEGGDANGSDAGIARPDWLIPAAQVWTGGLKDEAARMWSSGLRSDSPDRLALMLAEQLALAEADALYRQWERELPVVVLKHPHQEPSRWMVLVVPAAPDMERARLILTQALGPRIQWGRVSEWFARLTLAPSTSPEKQVQEHVPSATKLDKPAITASLPLATPPKRQQAPEAATVAAPPATTTVSQKVPDAVGENLSEGNSEISEIQRTTTSASDRGPSNSMAARAIDIDFETLEQQLVEGQYATARDGVLNLEKVVGVNWRTRYLMGVAESGLGLWMEAAAALTEARRLNPDHVRLALYLSVAQQELGQHTSAISTLYLLAEKHPNVPEVWLNQGLSYQALGQSEEARAAYLRFLDLSTGRTEMQAQREWVIGQIGDIK